jgi:gas vesicle protein
MIVTKHRQMYYKQKGLGIGFVNKEIYGNGIFKDTMKMLGKKLWIAGKTLFKNQILPNLKVASKYGLKSGKELIEDNKKEIGKVISDQSKNLIKNLLSKTGNTKQVISDTKDELINIIDKNKETVQQNSQEILNKLLYGEGLKVIKNSKRKR